MVQTFVVALMFVIRRVHHIVCGLKWSLTTSAPRLRRAHNVYALSHSPARNQWQYDARLQAALLSILENDLGSTPLDNGLSHG